MEKYKELAKEKMRNCRACKECNGIVCAGETPGCGGKGNGSTFIRNVAKLKDVRVVMNVVSSNDSVSTESDFFGKKVGLSVSTQFEAETFAQAFRKVYTFGPTFRADKSHTPYHLAEFWQIEPEVAFCDLDEIMDISERMMKYVIRYVLKHVSEEMEYLDKNISPGVIQKLKKVMRNS